MKSLNLLLVEDSIDDADILLYELERADYEVVCRRVETVEAMLGALSQQSWDIVISDFSMPRFGGDVALKTLQSTGLDIPFIMLSGAVGEEHAVEIMRAGASDYVMKDNLGRLIPAIQRELREAEERQARRDAEEQVVKLSRALEQSASLVMITGLDAVIEYVNDAFARITGYDRESLIGRHTRFLKSGSTPDSVYADLWETIGAGRTWRGELQNRKQNGDLFWVDTVISTIRNSDDIPVQYLCVQEDVTERKRLEAELRQYTDQLQQMVDDRTRALRVAKEEIELILNTTTDAIALAQPNGDMRALNATFREVFGDRVSKNIENILWTLGDESHVALVSSALVDAIYTQESQRVEAQILTSDGVVHDVDLMFIPVQLDEQEVGERPGVLVCAHDITPMKEIERFKERFIADAVHDLATPISGLSTRLHLLKKSPEKLDIHMRALENQVEHLRDLLNDLRTLSQLDRGQFALQAEPQNINTLVVRAFDTYEPVAINKGQTLTLTLDAEMPILLIDSRAIERVMVNLIANAISYTPEQKTIQVITQVAQDHIVFSVIDEGIGIHPDELPKIFERFYRSNDARMRRTGGTGLGLAISREIVEMHNGTIDVISEPGHGSHFTVKLPLSMQ